MDVHIGIALIYASLIISETQGWETYILGCLPANVARILHFFSSINLANKVDAYPVLL